MVTHPTRQPGEFDAVLGNTSASPVGAVILGGLEGVKQRLSSAIAEHRIAALWEASKQGTEGLGLLIQALQDPAISVQKTAYRLLQTRSEPEAQQALQHYSPYPLFECLYTLRGHTAGITAVAIGLQHFVSRPDQLSLISGSRDGMLKVWDLESQEAIFTLHARSFIYAISIDSDADQFLVKTKDQMIKAWQLKTGRQVAPPDQRTRSIASVTLSDRKYLISGSQNTIKVWDLQAGQERCNLRGHTSLVTAVAVSPDQHLIVSGSEDRTVKVWGIG